MKEVNCENINQRRMKILGKNFIRRSEAGAYIGCSPQKGRMIYDKLKQQLEDEGIIVNDCGLSVKYFNEYIGLSTQEIIELAKEGL